MIYNLPFLLVWKKNEKFLLTKRETLFVTEECKDLHLAYSSILAIFPFGPLNFRHFRFVCIKDPPSLLKFQPSLVFGLKSLVYKFHVNQTNRLFHSEYARVAFFSLWNFKNFPCAF